MKVQLFYTKFGCIALVNHYAYACCGSRGIAVDVEETEEGTLRGDKGVKNEVEVDQTSYLCRAISLARGEAYLLACAFLCLGVSSLSSLILPNYQVCVFLFFIQPCSTSIALTVSGGY